MSRALTKAQLRDLGAILADVSRADLFLASDRIAICLRKPSATTTADFVREPLAECLQSSESRRLGHYALSEVAKDIGSDLCRLSEARRALKHFLDSHAPAASSDHEPRGSASRRKVSA